MLTADYADYADGSGTGKTLKTEMRKCGKRPGEVGPRWNTEAIPRGMDDFTGQGKLKSERSGGYQGCIKLVGSVGTFRRNVRVCAGADASARRPYQRIVELDAALGGYGTWLGLWGAQFPWGN
jgi:hypothetical protein